MNKIPTLYSDYKECILDLDIYGKIVATPQQSIEELTNTLFEEFKRRKPLPTLEYKRYELSRLVNPEFRIAYNKELELQENESLIELNNSISSLSPLNFDDLTPLLTEVKEIFSYENGVTDLDRQSVVEKYNLDTGEVFKPGIGETENIVGSTIEAENIRLSDEEIEQLGSDEDYEVLDINEDDSTEIVQDFDIDDIEVEDDYIDYEVDYESNDIDSDADYNDDTGDIDSEDEISDDYIEDDYSDYDYDMTEDDTIDEDSASNEDDSEIDDSEYSDVEYDDYDDYGSYNDTEDDSENSDFDSSDSSSDDFIDTDSEDFDDYSEDDYSEDDYSEDDYSEDDIESKEGSIDTFIDSVLDEPDFVPDFEPVLQKEVEIPITPVQVYNKPPDEAVDRSSEPTDIRAFLRKHPRCEYDFALKYFTKKQINDAIKIGKIIKKGNILKI